MAPMVPSVPTTLRYQTKAINNEDVACNDGTGTIKLAPWRSCIECIQESGVYFIQQVKIKEWPKGIISLTTTPSTCIKISDQNMQKSKSSLKGLKPIQLNFFNSVAQFREKLSTVWKSVS